ncbi:MAG TPA: cytochrome b/b6 domain-containing protein [Acidimicrobiia bacterium]|nr:cytochrome b/b6 domain-containing protein [Acidimicrobiia bacterium]
MIPRFDRVERSLHWVNAALFLLLMATGAVLYIGSLSALVGRRELLRTLHVYAGIALPIPILVAIVGRHGARLRADLAALNRFAPGESRWFSARTRPKVRLGKFNPGQKLNAVFIAGAGVVMLGTGAIMKWFSLFPLDWRTGATFVHDWFSFAIWLVVLGHVAFALSDPVALGGMVSGSVSAKWAKRERPRWYRQVTTAENHADAAEPPLDAPAGATPTRPIKSGTPPSRR